MKTLTPIEQLNRDLADKVVAETQRDPAAYPGKFVGIANGQIVVVTDDLDEFGRRLRQATPDPANGFWLEIGRDCREVQEI